MWTAFDYLIENGLDIERQASGGEERLGPPSYFQALFPQCNTAAKVSHARDKAPLERMRLAMKSAGRDHTGVQLIEEALKQHPLSECIDLIATQMVHVSRVGQSGFIDEFADRVRSSFKYGVPAERGPLANAIAMMKRDLEWILESSRGFAGCDEERDRDYSRVLVGCLLANALMGPWSYAGEFGVALPARLRTEAKRETAKLPETGAALLPVIVDRSSLGIFPGMIKSAPPGNVRREVPSSKPLRVGRIPSDESGTRETYPLSGYQGVSRNHFEISKQDQQWVISDVGSTFGTTVLRGTEILTPDEASMPLLYGDYIIIGVDVPLGFRFERL